jgi:hypothetical protein
MYIYIGTKGVHCTIELHTATCNKLHKKNPIPFLIAGHNYYDQDMYLAMTTHTSITHMHNIMHNVILKILYLDQWHTPSSSPNIVYRDCIYIKLKHYPVHMLQEL